jgi:hypothetical protein
VTVVLRSSKVVSCISTPSEERLTKVSIATFRRQDHLEVQRVKDHGSRNKVAAFLYMTSSTNHGVASRSISDEGSVRRNFILNSKLERQQLASSVHRAGLRFSHFELSESVATVDRS